MSDIARNTSAPFDSIRQTGGDGTEFWSARDLMPLLGYSKWERFEDAVERARTAAANTGQDPDRHASRRREASGRTERVDYYLTRYGAYLVAMNGDSRKIEIAAAQSYFAVKTREAETAPPPLALTGTDLDAMTQVHQALGAAIEVARHERARAAELQAANAELEPKADSWNRLASAEGDYAVADAAKILSRNPRIHVGRDRLFTALRDLGWIYRQGVDGHHRAYQRAVTNGWLSELPASHYHPRTGQLVLDPPQVRVTVKGLHELHHRLGGHAPLQLPLPV